MKTWFILSQNLSGVYFSSAAGGSRELFIAIISVYTWVAFMLVSWNI
jgi:hypothetical protein